MLHICSLPYVRMTTVGPYAVPIGRNKFTIEVPCQLKPFACIVGFMTNKRIDGDIGITQYLGTMYMQFLLRAELHEAGKYKRETFALRDQWKEIPQIRGRGRNQI